VTHDHEALQLTMKMINAENQLLFASDFPHWDNSYPGNIDEIRMRGDAFSVVKAYEEFVHGSARVLSFSQGPGGAPECLWSTTRTSASVTITGKSAWPSTFAVTPFWSFDNRTYVLGSPVEVKSELDQQTAGCDGRAYRVLVWPKGHGPLKSTGFEAYEEPLADLYTGKGKAYADTQLGAYVGGAGHIELGPACAGQPSTQLSASDESLKATVPAGKLVICNLKTSGVVELSHDASDAAGFLSLFESSGKEVLTVSVDDSRAKLGFDSARCKASSAPK